MIDELFLSREWMLRAKLPNGSLLNRQGQLEAVRAGAEELRALKQKEDARVLEIIKRLKAKNAEAEAAASAAAAQ
eukprot:scaffold3654_cov24-Prasinocladus_malaysianus.AAC.2